MSLQWNLWERSGWSKKFQLYFKNYDFCENVKFGSISLKFDILWKGAKLKFESTYDFDYLLHTTFCFYLIDFQLNTNFPAQVCIF